MNDLMTRSQNTGIAAVEETAEIANIQAKMILARNFPRSPEDCLSRILNECRSRELAESAVYEFKRGDTVVTGASIRLLECAARYWGNMVSGIKELSSDGKKATVRAYCWDLETNYFDEKVFDVPYIRNTKKGSYTLTDERDKYEMMANMAARRKRACMQAVIPQYVVDEAVKECRRTLEQGLAQEGGGNIENTKAKLLTAFKEIADWISEEDIGGYVGKPFDKLSAQDIVKLRGLYNAIKGGFTKPESAFKKDAVQVKADENAADALDEVNGFFTGNEK